MTTQNGPEVSCSTDQKVGGFGVALVGLRRPVVCCHGQARSPAPTLTATAPSPVTNLDPTRRRRTVSRERGRGTAIALALAASALAFPMVGPGIAGGPNAYAESTVSASPAVSGPLKYRNSVFTDVDVARDVVYGQAPDAPDGGVDLLADICQPVGDVDPLRPVIVWMHGAGPASNDKAHAVDAYVDPSCARHGTLVMSINSRFKANGLNRPVDDAHQALAGLWANASTYRVDGSRIAIGGVSAGRIAALDTAYLDDIEAGAPEPDRGVRAASSISGRGRWVSRRPVRRP